MDGQNCVDLEELNIGEPITSTPVEDNILQFPVPLDQIIIDDPEIAALQNPVGKLESVDDLFAQTNSISRQTTAQYAIPRKTKFELIKARYLALSPLQRYYMKAIHYHMGNAFLDSLRNNTSRRMLEHLATLPDIELTELKGTRI